jgi:diguanylate cyclase (GGDEF)-like protein
MSSEKRTSRRPKPVRTPQRPILWVGGAGLPGGATGRKLVSLGNPLHWEPSAAEAIRSVGPLAPVLIVIEGEKVDVVVRSFLTELAELKATVDTVVFQLRRREPKVVESGFDGVLVRGASLVRQIRIVLDAMRGGRTFKTAGARAQKRLARVEAEVERLGALSVRDDLTSLYNLRFFDRSLETEHQRATRFGRSYALIFVDLDGLREVNSRGGHMAGALVLKLVGELIVNRIRRIDLAARIGGDEFVIICPETEKPAARLVAERLRHGIQKIGDGQESSATITASIGIASFPEDGDLPDEILQRADRALYEAKALGKNRVCCWGEFAVAGNDDKSFLGSVYGTTLESSRRESSKKAEGPEPPATVAPVAVGAQEEEE